MLTNEELERRKHFVTASDVAAVLGVSPWRNAADVYAEKVYGVTGAKNDAMDAGNLLEPVVLKWAETQLGRLHPGDWRVHEGGVIACTTDGMTQTAEPVEAKTTGIVGPGSPHQWGEAGTDQIPDYYLIQVQTQLLVTGAARAYVPALIGNRGFVLYVVNANPDLQGVIQANVEAFWNEHVQQQEPPEDVRPNLDTLKRVMRIKGKSVSIDDSLAENYLRASELASIANEELDRAKAAVIAAIGDGEIAKWSGGQFTFAQSTRKAYQVEESTYRTLRHRAAKETVCK